MSTAPESWLTWRKLNRLQPRPMENSVADLRVALPLSFGLRHMSAPIAGFKAQHPQLEFDLDLNDRRIDLLEEGKRRRHSNRTPGRFNVDREEVV